MPGVTLAQLRTRAFQRVDMVNSTFATTAEANQLVNTAGARLHDLLVTSYEDYFQLVKTFSLTANKEAYDLVADLNLVDANGNPSFYKVIDIFVTTGSGANLSRQKLRRFNTNELSRINNPLLVPTAMPWPVLYYRLVGSKLYFEPIATSTAGYSIELWYAPQFVQLVADADTLDYGVVFGWDEFIVNDVAINLRLKEESDVSALMARQAEFERKVAAGAQNRDSAEPSRVVDVEAGMAWGYGDGSYR